MASAGTSRIDPPSPPRPPNPPPPSPETKKYASISNRGEPVSRSRQDPPSPPRAPPPSPSKNTNHAVMTLNSHVHSDEFEPESFPRLLELTMTLGDVLDLTPAQTCRRYSYLYSEDDMSVPGSPPALEFSTQKPKHNAKRRAEDIKDCDIFGPCLSDTPVSDCKRRKAIDLEDNIMFLPSDLSGSPPRYPDFFSTLFSTGQFYDTTLLHEHFHVQSCT